MRAAARCRQSFSRPPSIHDGHVRNSGNCTSRAGDMAQFFAGKETVAVFVMRPPQSQAWYTVIAENENRREVLAHTHAHKSEISGV